MIDMEFYNTYYYCNVIKNIIENNSVFFRKLNNFYGDGRIMSYIYPFEKDSVLHQFIKFVIYEINDEELSSASLNENSFSLREDSDYKLPIERLFNYYDVDYIPFSSYLSELGKTVEQCQNLDIYYFVNEMKDSDAYGSLISNIAREVFHILFSNRVLMLNFNKMMASSLEEEILEQELDDNHHVLKKTGKLKRKTIPAWVRKAVFFRDKGRCVFCNKDLTNLINLDNKENYDHIVPLAKYGFNDVTNIQLLCKECNQIEKRANDAATSKSYHTWYD